MIVFGAVQRSAFIAIISVLTLFALRLRLTGFDPASLYLDDEWVGIVVRRMSYADFLRLKPPVPLGFVALEKLISGVSSDPEWPLQLVPMLCGLVQVSLTAVLALAITKERSAAIVAGAFAAASPMSIELSVRVKQYALDGLIVTALLLVGAPLLRRWVAGRAWAVALGAGASSLFSFPSVFVSVPLLHLAWLRYVWSRPGRTLSAASLAAVLSLDVALALVWATLLRGQSSPAMNQYWQSSFMPTALGPAVEFLCDRGWIAVASAFPPLLAPATVLIPLGLAVMAMRPQHRALAALLALVPMQLVVASALRLYPLGTGRTDCFAHPVFILCAAYGFSAVTDWMRRGVRRVWEASAAESGAVLVFTAGAVVTVLAASVPAAYPVSGDAQVVRVGADLLRPGDGLIVYPHGSIGVGYYGPWPLRLTPWPAYAHNFHVVLDRPNTVTLSPYEAYWTDPFRLGAELQAFLTGSHARVVYIAASFVHPAVHRFIVTQLLARGYRIEQARGAGYSEVLLFVAPNG